MSSLPPSIPPPALAELLAAAPLFSKLPPRVRGEVADRGVVRTLAPAERLLAVGAMNTSLFIVVSGLVEVLLPGGNRRTSASAPANALASSRSSTASRCQPTLSPQRRRRSSSSRTTTSGR